MIRIFKKKRGYPIKRDDQGKSARKRAFDAFDYGLTPKDVSENVEISLRTARRYEYDWRKLGDRFGLIYRIARESLKAKNSDRMQFAQYFADYLSISVNELHHYLGQPWGLHQLLSGKLKEKVRSGEKEKNLERLIIVCKLVYLEEIKGVPAKKILNMLEQLEQNGKNKKKDIQKQK